MSEALAKKIYEHCHHSKSFDESKPVLLVLLQQFKSLPAEQPLNASELDDLKGRILAERLVELRDITGNAHIHFEIPWASLTRDEVHFFNNNLFQRCAMAARVLCTDAIAKEALKNVTTIHVTSGTASAGLKGHTLEIAGKWHDLSQCPSDTVIATALDHGLRISYHRMLRTLTVDQIPAREKEIITDFGAKVTLKPDLKTFTTTTSLEFADNVVLLRLLMALRTVAFDATAKAAVGGVLKSVVFANVHSDNEYSVTFDPASGVLRLACVVDRAAPSASGTKILSNDEVYNVLMQSINVPLMQKRVELTSRLLPSAENDLKEALGVPVKYDVAFDTFSEADALNFVDNVACFRVAMACRCLGGDKDKVAKALKQVRIRNVANVADKSMNFSGGVLTLSCAFKFGLSGAFSDNEIQAQLKK